MLVKFSIDRRPKVRKCAQDCVVNVLKAFESSTVKHKASKYVLSLFKTCMKTVGDLSAAKSSNGSKDTLPKTEQLELLHMLNLLKHLLPYLSAKVKLEALSELFKLVTSRFSTLTRHIFDVIKTMFECIEVDGFTPEVEKLVNILASYISRRQNPSDTILSAAYLLRISMNNLHVEESVTWNSHLLLVFRSLGGLLTSEGNTASRASDYLKELINLHINVRNILTAEGQSVETEDSSKVDSAVKSICSTVFFLWFALSGWLFRSLIFATWVLPFASPLLIRAFANNLVIKGSCPACKKQFVGYKNQRVQCSGCGNTVWQPEGDFFSRGSGGMPGTSKSKPDIIDVEFEEK